jgi:hypothetical protein
VTSDSTHSDLPQDPPGAFDEDRFLHPRYSFDLFFLPLINHSRDLDAGGVAGANILDAARVRP